MQTHFEISIHALREEGDAAGPGHLLPHGDFYPRPPRGGRHLGIIEVGFQRNFYPRPPRGGRHVASAVEYVYDIFLSTPSARRATLRSMAIRSRKSYFYPRPPRGGRPVGYGGESLVADFYPRPPRGGRLIGIVPVPLVLLFLSTPSARRATASRFDTGHPRKFLSTPSARRAT